MEAPGARVQAVGIENGTIVFAGSDAEAACLEAARYVDLRGQTVLPGFIEGHMHLAGYGNVQQHVSLSDCRSAEECLERIRAYRAAHPAAKYIYARGWNEDLFAVRRYPQTEELNEAAGGLPALMVRICGHMGVCSEAALEQIRQLPQAALYRQNGQIQGGVLYENALELFDAILPKPSLQDVEAALKMAMADLSRCGITTCQTDDFQSIAGSDWRQMVEAYQDLEAKGQMSVRVYEQCLFTGEEAFREFLAAGYRTGQGGDCFRIGPLKMLQDGSLGARTALLKEPYQGTNEHGIAIYTQAQLDAMILLAHENGMQIAVHTIGDGAMEMVLEALEKAQQKKPRSDCRHGLVHVQIANRRILERMARHAVIAYIQPVFVDYDMDMAPQRVGQNRPDIYAWKTMEDLGILTVGGSDAPVESFHVLHNIYYAMTREHLAGGPEGGWMPEQKLSAWEAVSLFTTHGAKACFQEDRIGRLLPGMAADLAVLSGDLFTEEPHAILQMQVTATMMGGRFVYEEKQ